MEDKERTSKKSDSESERKKAKNNLWESEEKYKRIIEGLREEYFFYRHGTDGIFTYISPSVTNILGYSPDEFFVHYSQYLTPNLINQDVKKYTELSIKGIKQPSYDVELYHKDGSVRRIEVREVPVVDQHGKIVSVEGIARDVTISRKMKQELLENKISLENLVRELERSNKDLENFASIAAHDIKSPLSKMHTAAALLKNAHDKNCKMQDETAILNIIIRGAVKMSQMINSIYKCSKVEAGKIQLTDVDLNEVIQELIDFQVSTILKESHGQVLIPVPLHTIKADKIQITELFQNLITNGIKYQKKGIRPEVTVRSRKEGHAMIMVEVEDNGIGIEDSDTDKIFGMFERSHHANEYEGLGIGLAFCKKVVERHGGQISVRSQYGKGSTFWMTLPGMAK